MIVSVEEPEAVAGLGLKLALVFDSRPLTLRLTELDPLALVRVTVSVPREPRGIVKDDAEIERVKSGGGTTTVTVVECVRLPLIPVMVFVYVPAAALEDTATVKVEVAVEFAAGVTEVGLSEHEIGPEQFAVRPTAALNPFSEVTVTVPGEDFPATIVIGEGLSEMPKSGVVDPQALNLKEPIKVYQL